MTWPWSWWRHQMEPFSALWPFVRGIHRSPVNSPHKGQWRGALMFSLICFWISGWVNSCEAGDLRRHCAHYDVTVCDAHWWTWWCHRSGRRRVVTPSHPADEGYGGAVCFQFTQFPRDGWENILLCLIIIIKSEVWTIIHCLGLGHETMVCAVFLFIFLWYKLLPEWKRIELHRSKIQSGTLRPRQNCRYFKTTVLKWNVLIYNSFNLYPMVHN